MSTMEELWSEFIAGLLLVIMGGVLVIGFFCF